MLPLGSFVSSGVVAARYGVVGSGGSPVVFSGVGTDGSSGAKECVNVLGSGLAPTCFGSLE